MTPDEAEKDRYVAKEMNMKKQKLPQIVRTYSAGVFYAIVEKRVGKEAVLLSARRLWYWDGAASLSQLAVEGTKAPQNCKFPVAVPRIEVMEVIEILNTTEAARKSIESVPVWAK